MKETVAQEEKEEVGIYTPFPFPLKKCCVLKKNLHDLDNEKNLGKIQIKWTFDEVTEMKIIFIYVEKSSQTPPNNFGDASHAWNETFWPIFKPT